jgi:hypothetical protein
VPGSQNPMPPLSAFVGVEVIVVANSMAHAARPALRCLDTFECRIIARPL